MSRLRDRLSYARSILIIAPLIGIYTAIMGSISVMSSTIDSSGRIQHACARIWSRMILRTCGVRLQVEGAERLQPGKPYVLCVNHQSHMDIPVLLVALPVQFRFAAKKELFRVPFLGWHLRRSGHVPIDRGNPRAALKSLREAAEIVRRGAPLVIFPEGGTSAEAGIRPFKGGGFMLATQSGVEAVPVTLRGTREVLTPDTHHVRSGIVKVIVGDPIAPAGLSASELAERVHKEIVAAFYDGETVDRDSYTLLR